MASFEINGNLVGNDGLANIDNFISTVMTVMAFYHRIFGQETMSAIDLYVDNATRDSGHTPVITPIFNKFLIIKLCVESTYDEGIIAFQFAHELMHYVFYVKYGLEGRVVDEREESICTAASLIVLYQMYYNSFIVNDEYCKTHEKEEYRLGVKIAEQVGYNMEELKKLV